MDSQKHVGTMRKAAACALIALCSATTSLSAADNDPNYVRGEKRVCEVNEGVFTEEDDGSVTCCYDSFCYNCVLVGTSEVCTYSCKNPICCNAIGPHGACDWTEIDPDPVLVEAEDESDRPIFEELQADDSLVAVDEGGPSTLIDEFELSVGDDTPVADSSDDLEQYTPIGDSAEFVRESAWYYTPIGDSEDEFYMWVYTPIGYAGIEELPLQSMLDTLHDRAADLGLEDSEPQDDEDESVVETGNESPPAQDATNPGARRRDGRSRRRAGRN